MADDRPQDLIEQARAAIGDGRDDDYVLRPAAHAALLGDTAPALAAILRTSKLEMMARAFERLDQEAGAAQQRFKDNIGRANLAVLGTAVLSALMMFVGLLSDQLGAAVVPVILIVLGLGAVLTGAFGAMWLFQVREGGLLETWMKQRAAAETRRLGYFTLLLEMPNDARSAIPLPLLKLEYFRRFQLDMQINYYHQRRDQHRAKAAHWLMIAGVAVMLASFASGAAGMLGAFHTWLVAFAAFGVLGTALSGFASASEATNQDRRNGERYDRTLTALEQLRGRLDEVGAAVLGAAPQALEEYVAAVHEQLSLEHREWLESGESTLSAVAKLDQTLTKLGDERPSVGR